MNLHRQMRADLSAVFLNPDEFAEQHCIAGKKITCIVDDQQALALSNTMDNFADASTLGILNCDRVVYLRACELERPLPGARIEMDGEFWQVGEGVSVAEGLLTLPLVRNF